MKKLKVFLSFIVILLTIPLMTVEGASPYYTYTVDRNNHIIRTTEAYTPSIQINGASDTNFKMLQNIFIDREDYVYITDSQAKKIYILNPDFVHVSTLQNTSEMSSIKFPKSTFVTEDKIYVVDTKTTEILIFDRQALLENNEIVLIQTVIKPASPVFDGGYTYKPETIVVDLRGNIYVQGTGSPNGLMMLDGDGNFITFFGGNPLRMPVIDQIRSFFLTKAQKESKYSYTPDYPTRIAIDELGYVYTVTSTLKDNPIKKFNVSGRNFFKKDLFGTIDMNSIWVDQNNNVFAVNDDGYIFEYDSSGELLFFFGGKDNTNRVGLLKKPVSIATNSKGQILIADQGRQNIQVYEPTEFTKAVHQAIKDYDEGLYDESREEWMYILQYNSLFDYAHIGLGRAYYGEGNYELAYKEYHYATHYEGMSNAFWGIRQEFLKDHLASILTVIVILIFIRILDVLLNKKLHHHQQFGKFIQKLRNKISLLDELLYIFTFIKHPLNGFYEIKRENRVSMKSASVIYLLLALLFIFNYQYTSVLFIPKVGVNIAYELFIIGFVLALWIISNYLVCSINDGEGGFKNVYIATAYALTPILVISPFMIILSNGLTYQEEVFYSLGNTFMMIWSGFLMFFMIKDIHNYEVKQTIGVILKSLFTMLILGLMLFIINALSNQLISVIKEIIVEVSNR